MMTNSNDVPTRSRLPSTRAFVVHLLDDADPRCALPGRVEHVTSGRSARFDDVAALADFFRVVLADQDHANE
jgi:hypothetical protein